VGLGVQALRDELLLDARVPEVLHLVVRAPGEVLRDLRPPVRRDDGSNPPREFHMRRSINQLAGRGRKREGMKTLPVSEDAVDVDDGALLLLGEGAALQVRPEVVDPPEPAALAAPLQPCRRPP
jgi:hypothetical protein